MLRRSLIASVRHFTTKMDTLLESIIAIHEQFKLGQFLQRRCSISSSSLGRQIQQEGGSAFKCYLLASVATMIWFSHGWLV